MTKVGNWVMAHDAGEAWNIQSGFGLRVVLWPNLDEGGYGVALTHVSLSNRSYLCILDRADSLDLAKAKLRADVEQLAEEDVELSRIRDVLPVFLRKAAEDLGLGPHLPPDFPDEGGNPEDDGGR